MKKVNRCIPTQRVIGNHVTHCGKTATRFVMLYSPQCCWRNGIRKHPYAEVWAVMSSSSSVNEDRGKSGGDFRPSTTLSPHISSRLLLLSAELWSEYLFLHKRFRPYWLAALVSPQSPSSQIPFKFCSRGWGCTPAWRGVVLGIAWGFYSSIWCTSTKYQTQRRKYTFELSGSLEDEAENRLHSISFELEFCSPGLITPLEGH